MNEPARMNYSFEEGIQHVNTLLLSLVMFNNNLTILVNSIREISVHLELVKVIIDPEVREEEIRLIKVQGNWLIEKFQEATVNNASMFEDWVKFIVVHSQPQASQVVIRQIEMMRESMRELLGLLKNFKGYGIKMGKIRFQLTEDFNSIMRSLHMLIEYWALHPFGMAPEVTISPRPEIINSSIAPIPGVPDSLPEDQWGLLNVDIGGPPPLSMPEETSALRARR